MFGSTMIPVPCLHICIMLQTEWVRSKYQAYKSSLNKTHDVAQKSMQCQHILLSKLSTAYTLKESQTAPLTKAICIEHTELQTGPNRLSLYVMP